MRAQASRYSLNDCVNGRLVVNLVTALECFAGRPPAAHARIPCPGTSVQLQPQALCLPAQVAP